ncbi:MAG: ankyrin repeat domain-containing protein [Chlamydiales bacterium]|nr:ankyrin repeat domain-containing protein [Chlamydiales bacterium]
MVPLRIFKEQQEHIQKKLFVNRFFLQSSSVIDKFFVNCKKNKAFRMTASSMSMALIPYTPPKSPAEFIRSEVERALANGSISIEQTIPRPIPATYLSWKERTSEVNLAITRAFQAIASNTNSQWGLFNGSYTYGIGGIKEHKLMKKIIREAPSETKDFYALDIGAGNYQWGRGLAEYLNTKKDIPKDVIIHIIGIRGETNLEKAVTELGQCRLYELGQFHIETLIDEFEKRGLQLANKVDVVVSRWCFRHLVDPVGTFTQAYDLLRPKTGHLLLDGFFFLHENETMRDESIDFNEKMIRLCLETRAPFLTRYYNSTRSLDHFVVIKTDERQCHLHKQYLGTENPGWGWQIGSETVTRFKELEGSDIEAAPLLWEGEYRGDKDMYEWLRQNGLLDNSNLVWGPLQDKDTEKKTPPLHIAIAAGDEEAIDRCLRERCDINESDDIGFTPLHLAIKHNNYRLFSLLLEKGALTKLFAKGYTPIHLAMQYDFSGRFITDFITAGIDINIKPNRFHWPQLTPLDCAIKHKNVKAIELLLAARVIVNYRNFQSLDSDPTFSSIQPLLPKRLNELEGFDTIMHHIQKRDCVILVYPDRSSGWKFQKPTQLEKEGKIIRVTVNPETRLLDDRNYEVIADMSGCKEEFTFGEDIGKVPDLELRFGY